MDSPLLVTYARSPSRDPALWLVGSRWLVHLKSAGAGAGRARGDADGEHLGRSDGRARGLPRGEAGGPGVGDALGEADGAEKPTPGPQGGMGLSWSTK